MKIIARIGCLLSGLAVIACASPAGAVGTGGTGLNSAYVKGAVAIGHGIVVNGTRFSATRAQITVNSVTGQKPAAVVPGMVAQIAGTVSASGTQGIAQTIDVSRVVRGIVTYVGTGGTGLSVGGIGVKVQATTVGVGYNSVADIAMGDTLDVYGYVDVATASVQATRIERVAAVPQTEVRGVITAVAAATLQVDGLSVDYTQATLSGFDGAPQVGDEVVVEGAIASPGIVATSVSMEVSSEPDDGSDAEVEGGVLAITGPGLFTIDTVEVNATNAVVTGGTLASITVGSVLHVHGTVVAGILVATSVDFDDGSESETEDIDGTISSYVSTGSFVVDGDTVDASHATITGGTAADLANGVRVTATGQLVGRHMVAATLAISRRHRGR
jgi:hypothetical protein